MNENALVSLLGFSATLIHGDPLVLDRWLWLQKRLPRTRNRETLLDVGCGSGAFTIGAALRGYQSLGLSWDERNQRVAGERARLCGADKARFAVVDARKLGESQELSGEQFDAALCCEVAEHVLDDFKLCSDMAKLLKPGGRLLFTAPYLLYRPLSIEDEGPFLQEETGGHVRRGYNAVMLRELAEKAGLVIEEISYCSGFFSQVLARIERWLGRFSHKLAWVAILPFRWLPWMADDIVNRVVNVTHYSICMQACKPRHSS